MNLSPQERAAREEDVRRSRHSIEMEGGQVSPETAGDQDGYARGEITEAVLMERLRVRYGQGGNA